MANKENLISLADRTTEEKREIAIKGGIASGEARREKATMKATLEMLLDETYKNGKTYRDLATLGLIKGAINGNAQNYRLILETLGELKAIEDDKMHNELSKLDEILSTIKEEASK